MRLPLTITVAWAALWLVGSWWCAVDLEAAIQTGASKVLLQAGIPMKRVEARASGQSVHLVGSVRQPGDVEKAVALISTSLQMPHSLGVQKSASAVRSVTAKLDVDLKPVGWGLLAINGAHVQLVGITSSTAESERLGTQLRRAFSGGSEVRVDLEADPEQVHEADAPTPSADQIEGFDPKALQLGLVAIVRWGGPWKMLDLERPLEKLRQESLTFGLPADLWEERLGGLVRRIQDVRRVALASQREQRRQESLPAGHVVLAVRADTILLKGELGSPQAERILREAVQRAVGTRRLVDELLHDPQRRPESDMRKLVAGMPSLPTGNSARFLAAGTADAGWRVIDLAQIDVEDANSILPGMLPAGSDRRLMIGDVASAAVWIHSISASSNTQPKIKPTAYFFLVLVGHRALLYGAVPDEGLRTQTESGIRQRYPALQLDSQLRVDPHSVAGESPLFTLGTLPAYPGAETSGLLAFALVGEEWRTKAARASLLEAATLAQSGLLPDGFPVNILLPDLLAAAPFIRSHLKLHEQTAPPGIPLQIIGPR